MKLAKQIICPCMAAVALFSIGCNSGGSPGVVVDDKAERRFAGTDGEDHALPSLNGNRLQVFIFSRTDCPISNRYAPRVAELSEEYREAARFWLVYVDPTTTLTEMQTHLKEFSYPCTGVHDPEHRLVALSGANITPEAAVFGRQGELLYTGRIDDRYESFGNARPAATTHDLRNAIEAALAGDPIPKPGGPAVGCYISDLQ